MHLLSWFYDPQAIPSLSLDDFVRAASRAGREDVFVLHGKEVIHKSPAMHLDEQEKELNTRTWKAFELALRNTFSDARFERLVNRYNIHFDRYKEAGLPLGRRYIEAAGVAATCCYTSDLDTALKRSKPDLKRLNSSQLWDLNLTVTKQGYLGKDIPDPEKISGGPKEKLEYFIQSNQRMDARRCRLFEGVENLLSSDPNIPRSHPYYSRLTMAIISLLETEKRKEDRGIVIPAPGNREGEIDFYTVFEVISYRGLTAFALIPISNDSQLPPLICFRCTKQSFAQSDSVQSMQNDTESNIGESGYLASKHRLQEVMNNKIFTRNNTRKPIVTAYSLGGSHAAYFMKENWKKIDSCIFFNAVGNNEVVDDISNQINALPEDQVPPSIYHYSNTGDYVHFAGQKHVGYGVTHPNALVQSIEFDVGNHPIPEGDSVADPSELMKCMKIHAIRPLDSKERYNYRIYRGRECDEVLDNKRYKFVEEARKKWGVSILHEVIRVIYEAVDFIFRLFGIEYFRRNLEN